MDSRRRAITIEAPPSDVWPWLVQVGFGRAGFYSNDLLDNVAHPNADRILEEFLHPQVGDWVPMFSKANDTTAFKVAAIDPCTELLWFEPDSTWARKLTASTEARDGDPPARRSRARRSRVRRERPRARLVPTQLPPSNTAQAAE